MIEQNTVQKAFAFFCDYPTTAIHLRELSRRLSLSMPAVISAVGKLEKEGLVTVDRQRAWTMVRAAGNERFVRLKRVRNLERLYESGLVDALVRIGNHPQAIVCFGSYSRGEDAEQSDIDIAIINGRSGELPETYGKTLRRPVSLHFPKMNRVSSEFRENLRNGIILEGAW